MDTIFSFLGKILAYAFVILLGLGTVAYVIRAIIDAFENPTINFEKQNLEDNDDKEKNDNFTSNYFQNTNITIK